MLQEFWADEVVEQLEWYNIEVICFGYFLYSFGIFATIFMGFLYFVYYYVWVIRYKNIVKESKINGLDEKKVMFDRFIINKKKN